MVCPESTIRFCPVTAFVTLVMAKTLSAMSIVRVNSPNGIIALYL